MNALEREYIADPVEKAHNVCYELPLFALEFLRLRGAFDAKYEVNIYILHHLLLFIAVDVGANAQGPCCGVQNTNSQTS